QARIVRDAERRDARSHAERGNEKPVPTVFVMLCATLVVSPFVAGIFSLSDANPAAITERIDPDGIKGALVVCGGGKLPDSVRDKFVELAGGQSARLALIPTASEDESIEEDGREVAEIWKAREPASITIIHSR